jgi:hypothetical protein
MRFRMIQNAAVAMIAKAARDPPTAPATAPGARLWSLPEATLGSLSSAESPLLVGVALITGGSVIVEVMVVVPVDDNVPDDSVEDEVDDDEVDAVELDEVDDAEVEVEVDEEIDSEDEAEEDSEVEDVESESRAFKLEV